MQTAITVINPWHNPQSAYSTRTYTLSTAPVFTHRGVSIYRYISNSFLYVFDGMAITHRAGWDKTSRVIDGILDGKAEYISDTVAAHLRKSGFSKVQGYSDTSLINA